MNLKLLTYDSVLSELQNSKSKNNLLLGNGFNLSLGVNTNYKNIFEIMKQNNKDYSIIDSNDLDLEKFIGACLDKIVNDNSQHTKFLTRFIHNKIKLDFMKAITQIVSKEIKNIYHDNNSKIYLLLKNFDNYFTLNYDPFLYQLLLSYKTSNKQESGIAFNNSLFGKKELHKTKNQKIQEEIEKAINKGTMTFEIDGDSKQFYLNKLSKTDFKAEMKQYYKGQITFTKLSRIIDVIWEEKEAENIKCLNNIYDGFNNIFGKDLEYCNPKTQNLFFIHGAFHIRQKGKKTEKITQQANKSLYTKIEEIVEKENEDIICIFSNDNKENEIMKNEYLTNGINKLEKLEGTLLIIGSSLADNDSHIFKRINNSNISKIFISCEEKNKNKIYKSAINFFPKKEICLLDQWTISYR